MVPNSSPSKETKSAGYMKLLISGACFLGVPFHGAIKIQRISLKEMSGTLSESHQGLESFLNIRKSGFTAPV